MFGGNVGALSAFLVYAVVVSELKAGVYHLGSARIYLYLHSVSAQQFLPGVQAGGEPFAALSAAVLGLPNAVVLKTSIDVVGRLVVDLNRVELTYGWAIVFGPVGSVVVADVDASVVSIDQVARPFRIDPQGVVVGVHVAFVN